MAYGTLTSFDALAASQQSVVEFGEDRAFEGIQAYFDIHNRLMREQINAVCEPTTIQLARYGGVDTMQMDEGDEYSRPDAQKITAGYTVGFPLRLQTIALQWTRLFFLNKSASDLAIQVIGALDAHRRRVSRDIRTALFKPTNNLTYVDVRSREKPTLPLRALLNADGQAIPPGPNGEIFDGATHTHYLARAGGSVAASDITALLDTVREHHTIGNQLLYINRAQEAAIRAMTANFTPYIDARLVPPNTATTVAGGTLDRNNSNNRAIGLFDGVEVWVKPWIPASYMWTWIQGVKRPLAFRERAPGGGILKLMAEDEQYPLRAQISEAEYGISVWERTNGAVLYTGGTSFVAPTITD